MSRYLLLVAVGPVQPFIAASRKIRDLWQGSKMLSALSEAVANALKDKSCKVVFPSLEPLQEWTPEEQEYGMANKILAWHHGNSPPEELAKFSEDTFRDKLRAYFEDLESELRKEFVNEAEGLIDFERLQRQRDDYGEFYAVWTPCATEVDYSVARSRAEELLAARKMTRTFTPPTWTSNGARKNTLDGERETVLKKVSEESPLVKKHIIKPREHLDALSLAKRWFGRGRDRSMEFQTLTDVALVPYKQRIKTLGEAYENARTAIQELPSDPRDKDSLLFRDRIDALERQLPPDTRANSQDALRKARAALSALYQKAGAPPAYACIVHADGDAMGKALDEIREINIHQAFGVALDTFAAEMRKVVIHHQGTLIYSGGDDVLAFLPVHTALPCVREIRATFKKCIDGLWKRADFKDPLTKVSRPTLSAGLVIVHHQDSLQGSVMLSRKAEATAKKHYGRDALAIIRSMRSGGEITVGGKWDEFAERFTAMIQSCANSEVPARLAHQLHGLLARIGDRKHRTARFFGAMPDPQIRDKQQLHEYRIGAEVEWLLSSKEGGDTLLKELKKSAPEAVDIDAFANELIVARHFARVVAVTLANPPRPQPDTAAS